MKQYFIVDCNHYLTAVGLTIALKDYLRRSDINEDVSTRKIPKWKRDKDGIKWRKLIKLLED